MGAWGLLAFDNDAAGDWADNLVRSKDLKIVEQTLVKALSEKYVSGTTGSCALAACEVIARLRGNFGYRNSYTKNLDEWIETLSVKPAESQVKLASEVIDRILSKKSELHDLWCEGSDGHDWIRTVEELRGRLSAK